MAWLVVAGVQPFFELSVLAKEVKFNSTFLPEGSENLDMTPFEKGNAVLPGDYRVDVFVNERPVGRKSVHMQAQDKGDAIPCFTPALLDELGVAPEALLRDKSNGSECAPLSQQVAEASAVFDIRNLEMRVSVPQASLRRDARGYVNPELWNSGTTAGTLNYSANATRTLKGLASDSAYLGYDAGLNVGDWRLRYNGSLNWLEGNGGVTKQDINTYIQRDITALQSQLTLGDTYTPGDLFDSYNFRGVQLASDDRMLPDSLNGYAPVIRGIARTGARVVVRQGGNIVLETLVAPGAFVIDDLYANGYAGDLDVTVYEADGSQQRSVVANATVSQLLRPGATRFSATAGELRSTLGGGSPSFVQGTYQYGLSNLFTAEGGGQASNEYWSVLTGMAFNTPLGAMSLDLTQSRTQFKSGAEQGRNLRLLYSKALVETGSYFTAASYWYSSKGAQGLTDAQQRIEYEQSLLAGGVLSRVKSRQQVVFNQSMGTWGQFSASAYSQNYWNADGRDLQYQLTYGRQIGRVGVTLNANRSRTGLGDLQNTYLMTMSMPLEFGSKRFTQVRAGIGRDVDGNYNQDLYLSGTAGENNQFSYGIGAQHEGAGGTSGGSLTGQYLGNSINTGANYNEGSGYANLGLTASGAVVAHPKGVTFTPFNSDTIAVVTAPGAEGAQVVGYPGVSLDGQGNAVVPYLRPYAFNDVGIDPRGTSLDVELAQSSRKVVPRAGAVLAVNFATQTGHAVLLKVKQADGQPVPFGASVQDVGGNVLGLVGQSGQLYARAVEGTDRLLISWGNDAAQRCAVEIAPPAKGQETTVQQDAVCIPNP